MNAAVKISSLGLILLLGSTAVLGNDRDERLLRREARIEQRQQAQPDNRGRQQEARPDARPEPQNVPQQADPSKRNGRMSPDDRRALRRQIDQAGHDIYKR
jgi:hypothetical protein